MRLYNPQVCSYPEAKPRDNCKQVGYNTRVGVVYLTYMYTALCMSTMCAA